MLEAVLGSPLVPRVAQAHPGSPGPSARALRHLVPTGFSARGEMTEAQARRHREEAVPDRAGLSRSQIPQLLAGLGFTPGPRRAEPRTSWSIRPAGAGHAMGAARREDHAHLRTRVGGRRHELQGLQHRGPRDGPQRGADLLPEHHRLHAPAGVPNNAFTEALASSFKGTTSSCCGLPDLTRRARRRRRSTTSGPATR